MKTIYSVYKEPDGSGFYAGAEYGGWLVWRSLTSQDESRAERWKQQAHCHGVNAHTEDCVDCRSK